MLQTGGRVESILELEEDEDSSSSIRSQGKQHWEPENSGLGRRHYNNN